MSRRSLPLALLAAALAVSSAALPVRAQLPLYVPEVEPEPASAPVVAGPPDPAPTPSEAAPPSTAVAPPPAVLGPSPAKVTVIGFGQHPYDDDDDDDDDDAPALAPRRTWYGWQTLVVDGAALSTLLLGGFLDSSGGTQSDVFTAAGLLGYELGPGIVHFAHRNPGRGFASFGIRLGLPLAGAFASASVYSNCDGYRCEEDGAAVGLLLGMAGAIAIDAAVFAYDDRRTRARARARWVPLASLRPGRAWVGFGGEL